MEFLICKDTPAVPHKKHWQFCVGSGHALLALRTDYVRQLRFIHDTLGIQRVRFHGIFNDDMRTCSRLTDLFQMEGAENFREYNFHACGIAYDNVLEAGMKPFVELSFMPRHLMSRDEGRGKEGGFFYKPLIVPPEDEQAWADYIRAFVRFLVHRYGAEEVRTWYFEVWNEPDLPGAFFNGSRDEYFRMYEVTARAIKAEDSRIPVGGPSTSGSKWVSSFLRFCRENDVPVDFVTTHQYAGDPLGGVEDQGDPLSDREGTAVFDFQAFISSLGYKLNNARSDSMLDGLRAVMGDQSEEQDIPNDGFFRNSAIVRRQAGSMPLYYTEWNENSGFSAFTNDTRKVAAYDVKAALDVADHMDGSSIWCFSDIFEEFHPFPEEFHGGFGMLSQSGIPKPVYHAMKMLADAGDERLVLGENATWGEIGIAAFRQSGDMQVLLFRQKMKNLDLPGEKAVVKIELSRAPKQVLLRRVDESHGNPLRLWEEMGRPRDLNRQEVEELKRQSAVTDESWPFAFENGILTLEAELGVNDVYYFQVIN